MRWKGADIVPREIKLQNVSLLSRVDDRLRLAKGTRFGRKGWFRFDTLQRPTRKHHLRQRPRGIEKIRQVGNGRRNTPVLFIAAQKRYENRKRLSKKSNDETRDQRV